MRCASISRSSCCSSHGDRRSVKPLATRSSKRILRSVCRNSSHPHRCSPTRRRTGPQPGAKNVEQTRRILGYTLSLERPSLFEHRLRFNTAVMPEKDGLFYWELLQLVYYW